MFPPLGNNFGLSNLSALRNMQGAPTFGTNPPGRLPFQPGAPNLPAGGATFGGNPPTAYPVSPIPPPSEGMTPPIARPQPILGAPGAPGAPIANPVYPQPIQTPQPMPWGGNPPGAAPGFPGLMNGGLQNLLALRQMGGY